MMCTSYMSNYYLCIFKEIIKNKKLEKNDRTDDDVYIMYIKIHAINIYSKLVR
jgi:hypothetical protein